MAGVQDRWWGDETEAAELIWCAAHLHRIIAPPSPEIPRQPEDLPRPPGGGPADSASETATLPPATAGETEQRIPIATPPKPSEPLPATADTREPPPSQRASPVRVPDAFPLPSPSAISKALLPLARRVPGLLANELDIDVTVEQTAEASGLPMLAFRPPLERWFEVHLLIDRSPSMAFWGDLAEGVATLFRWQGFFRDVRVWQFETGGREPRLLSGAGHIEREMGSLIAPGRQRLFVVLTDTLGQAWHSGAAFAALAVLGEQHPVSLAHVFPQTLWQRTALEQAIQRPLVASQPGCANSRLKVAARLPATAGLYRFPIFNLSPSHFRTWANFLAGSGSNSIQGVLLRESWETRGQGEGERGRDGDCKDRGELGETAEELLRGFLNDASPEARELAKVLAAVPLIPPVMRLAQQQFLSESQPWHLAEVFFSGLLQKSDFSPAGAAVPEAWYEFRTGIRQLLLENSPVQRTAEIWGEIGDFIERHYGSLRDFPALIPNPAGSMEDVAADREHYFAEVDAAVLMTWGGEYAEQAREILKEVKSRKQEKRGLGGLETSVTDEIAANFPNLPPLEDFDYTSPIIVFENLPSEPESTTVEVAEVSSTEPSSVFGLVPATKMVEVVTFTFEEVEEPETLERFPIRIATLEREKSGWVVRYREAEAERYIEQLSESVSLEMVAIPAGEFDMGSPGDEPERYSTESPVHRVKVPSFFMGRYPVTQAQWRVVASLPQVNRQLNPNPSWFEGDDRPVERVTWYDAVEFCDRLQRSFADRLNQFLETQRTDLSGYHYRLPTEAEWEYACRSVISYQLSVISEESSQNPAATAGTKSKSKIQNPQYPPFHFGQTISTEVANYNGSSYAGGPSGNSRGGTTPVTEFNCANAFGLSDMHGNVWEWCLDHWHENYQGAPTDGSAWLTENDNASHVIRGGSWNYEPRNCRSACRNHSYPGNTTSTLGFRIVLAPR